MTFGNPVLLNLDIILLSNDLCHNLIFMRPWYDVDIHPLIK